MDILNALGITIAAEYQPHKTPAGESPELRWTVSLRRNGREFHRVDFSAGCGHSPEYKNSRSRVTAAVVQECETGRRANGTPVPPPEAADVVHSLLLDASGTDETFEDWARGLGYDPDSRTAERVFHACRDTAAALRRTFTRDELEQLEQAFADY